MLSRELQCLSWLTTFFSAIMSKMLSVHYVSLVCVFDIHLAVVGNFSKKSSDKTCSISDMMLFTSFSGLALNWWEFGHRMQSVEKKLYRSCKLVIDWHVRTRWEPFNLLLLCVACKITCFYESSIKIEQRTGEWLVYRRSISCAILVTCGMNLLIETASCSVPFTISLEQ